MSKYGTLRHTGTFTVRAARAPRKPPMSRPTLVALCLAATLSGCAVVQYNDGERVSLEHDGTTSMDAVQAKADAACALTGRKRAQHVATVHKVPGNPLGVFAATISSYRCVPVD